jgi:hypothetical protein
MRSGGSTGQVVVEAVLAAGYAVGTEFLASGRLRDGLRSLDF